MSAQRLKLLVIGLFWSWVIGITPVQAETYYFHTDHLGAPQIVTDVNQAVVWQGDYDPYGEVTETVATVEQNLRFPGQYLDRESGLHYNYFRSYDQAIERYVQSDPIGLLGGINTYTYALNNPVLWKDPFGLQITAFRIEVSQSFFVFHTNRSPESGGCEVEDEYENYETLGIYTIENAPCYFICSFTDKEWRELMFFSQPGSL